MGSDSPYPTPPFSLYTSLLLLLVTDLFISMSESLPKRKHRVSDSNTIINIDGIPRPIGTKKEFVTCLILNLAWGILLFFCSYLSHKSIASRMGCICGIGCLSYPFFVSLLFVIRLVWFILIGAILVILYAFSLLREISLYVAGIILIFIGIFYTLNSFIKYLMSRRFATEFVRE